MWVCNREFWTRIQAVCTVCFTLRAFSLPICPSNPTNTAANENWLLYNHSCGEEIFSWVSLCLCMLGFYSHILILWVFLLAIRLSDPFSLPRTQSSDPWQTDDYSVSAPSNTHWLRLRLVQCSWKAGNKAGVEEEVGVRWDASPKVTNTCRKMSCRTVCVCHEQEHQKPESAETSQVFQCALLLIPDQVVLSHPQPCVGFSTHFSPGLSVLCLCMCEHVASAPARALEFLAEPGWKRLSQPIQQMQQLHVLLMVVLCQKHTGLCAHTHTHTHTHTFANYIFDTTYTSESTMIVFWLLTKNKTKQKIILFWGFTSVVANIAHSCVNSIAARVWRGNCYSIFFLLSKEPMENQQGVIPTRSVATNSLLLTLTHTTESCNEHRQDVVKFFNVSGASQLIQRRNEDYVNRS